MILSFGLDTTCARSKDQGAGTRAGVGAGSGAETGAGAIAGAGSDLMKYQII